MNVLLLCILSVIVNVAKGTPVNYPVNGTNNRAADQVTSFTGENKTTHNGEYSCQTTVPSAQVSLGTARDCETHNETHYFNHPPEKTVTDTCCIDRDHQLYEDPNYCGSNGELTCYMGLNKPVCTCDFGWNGATCNETYSKKVSCTCYKNTRTHPLVSELKYPKCEQNYKPHNQSRCIKETVKDVCICDDMRGEFSNTLPECIFKSDDSEVNKNQTEQSQTTSGSNGVKDKSSGASGRHGQHQQQTAVIAGVTAFVVTIALVIVLAVRRQRKRLNRSPPVISHESTSLTIENTQHNVLDLSPPSQEQELLTTETT